MAREPMPTPDPLILTARLDAASARLFQDLRDAHFPARSNIVPAHLTLFHQLPHQERIGIDATLAACCGASGPVAFRSGAPRFLGRGVAIPIEAAPLASMRQHLAATWTAWLTRQDQQTFRPHVTVQNKVLPSEARSLFEKLAVELPSFEGAIVGLELWIYRHGPWEFAAHHPFAASSDARSATSSPDRAATVPAGRDQADA